MSSPSHQPDTIIVPERFRGPPKSGNGGYAGGAFAGLLGLATDQPVEVTLRSPVPLDEEMTVHRQDADRLSVHLGDALVAEVARTDFDLVIPEPPTFEEALAAQPGSLSLKPREGAPTIVPGGIGFHPICFCCGAGHDEGLKVFAAGVNEQQVAAAWQTREDWGDEAGNLPNEFIWTALDCPGQMAFANQGVITGLLGRITAVVHKPAIAGERYVITGWPVSVDGKKHFAGTAMFNAGGQLVAEALAIWIGRRAQE